MRMLRDNLLVKVLKRKQLGKIVTPDTVKEDWYRGEVILAGPMVGFSGLEKKMETVGIITEEDVQEKIKVGDIVLFPPCYRGTWPTVIHDEQEMIILPEKDIWAIE